MFMRSTILVLAVFGATGCVATGPATPGRSVQPSHAAADAAPANDNAADRVARDRARALILAELTSYYRDLSARDWDAFASHFWRGAVITTVWQPDGESERRVDFISVPRFIAEADLGPGSKEFFEETMGTVEVHVQGNLAMVWAEYRARFGDPGDIREWSGIDAFTLMKHLGVWKITSMAFAAE